MFFIQTQCKILVRIEGKEFNNPRIKIRCSFKYKDNDYILPVTGIVVEQEYKNKPEGEYDIRGKYLCVSLGLEYDDGYLYLFVATIL